MSRGVALLPCRFSGARHLILVGHTMKRTPVLLTSSNPNGWKLEELLEQLASELEAKSENIANIDAPAACLYIEVNKTFNTCFRRMAEEQRKALDYAKRHPFTVYKK